MLVDNKHMKEHKMTIDFDMNFQLKQLKITEIISYFLRTFQKRLINDKEIKLIIS